MGRIVIRKARIIGEDAYIPLTKGYEAVVDLADLPMVEKWNWFPQINGKTIYAVRKERTRSGSTKIYMHRLIMGSPLGAEIDHIDRQGFNNRRRNLRIATRSENMINTAIRVDNTSGFKGVYSAKGKWMASIKINGVQRHLGYFVSPIEASIAYNAAAKIMRGVPTTEWRE